MDMKTPGYTRKAIDKYKKKKYQVLAALPAEYKELIIDRIGMSGNAYINMLVTEDLRRRGLLPGPDSSAGNTGPLDDAECPFD